MMNSYNTVGTCSVKIDFDVVNGKVYNVKFLGGWNVKLKGISALVEGIEIEQVIEKLKGIKCGNKPTSCPDQLARALSTVVAQTKG